MYIVSLHFSNEVERILQNVSAEELHKLHVTDGFVHFSFGENEGFSVNMNNVMCWNYQLQKEELNATNSEEKS